MVRSERVEERGRVVLQKLLGDRVIQYVPG